MNAARSVKSPATPVDPAAIAAANLSRDTPAANADAFGGWSAAYDAGTGAMEVTAWAMALAGSIKRAIDANDLIEARHLACMQQYIFAMHEATVEANIREAKQALDALRRGGKA